MEEESCSLTAAAFEERVIDTAKRCQQRHDSPATWAMEMSKCLNSRSSSSSSIVELGQVLVSYLCFQNNHPTLWKFLDYALSSNLLSPVHILSLLTARVFPHRRSQPQAFRLYLELLTRYALDLRPVGSDACNAKIIESVDVCRQFSQTYNMEDYSGKNRVGSSECCDPLISAVQNPAGSSLISSTATQFTSPNTVIGTSSGSNTAVSDGTCAEDAMRNCGTNGCLVSADSSHDESYMDRSSTTASTFFKDQESSDLVSVNDPINKNAVNDFENSADQGVSQVCPEPSCSYSQNLEVSASAGVRVENHESGVTAVHNSHSGSVSHVSDLPVAFHSLGDESFRGSLPAGLGFLVSNREQDGADGSVLHVDVVSISSNILPWGDADTNNREARRNSRRMFWDAFSRRSSRRLTDSPTIVFSTDDSDDLGSHDRWLLDFSSEVFDGGVGGDSGYLGRRIHSLNEQRRHSRSEIWERLRAGLDDDSRQTTICPSGLHPDGTCLCDSIAMSENSDTHAISRIVMLAEALFEI